MIHCPKCGEDREVRRGGGVFGRFLRELSAPQKYHCGRCDFRWLAWPWIYRGEGPLRKRLRHLRRDLLGSGAWDRRWVPEPTGPSITPGPTTL